MSKLFEALSLPTYNSHLGGGLDGLEDALRGDLARVAPRHVHVQLPQHDRPIVGVVKLKKIEFFIIPLIL